MRLIDLEWLGQDSSNTYSGLLHAPHPGMGTLVEHSFLRAARRVAKLVVKGIVHRQEIDLNQLNLNSVT